MMSGTLFMGTMGLGLLITTLLVIAVAWGVIAAWKHMRDGGRTDKSNPETILKSRYAPARSTARTTVRDSAN